MRIIRKSDSDNGGLMNNSKPIIRNPNCPCSCFDCAWDKEGVEVDKAVNAVPVTGYESTCGSKQVVTIDSQLHLERNGRYLPILSNTPDGKRVAAILES